MQVRWADLASTEQLKPLGEDLFELVDRATLEKHVPVRTYRLLGLALGLLHVDPATDLPRLGIFPLERDLGLVRHCHRERVPIRTDVLNLLTGSHFHAALVLEALCSEPSTSQCTFSHV